MKVSGVVGVLALAFSATAAQGAPLITIEQMAGTTQAERLASKQAKLLSLGSFSILEDFESETTPLGGSTNLATGVGTFSIGGGALNGTGGACIDPCDSFYVLDEATSPFDGRYNTTEGGERWLDSNDITAIELTLAEPLDNLFFFITDVHDVRGTLTLIADDGTTSSLVFPGSGGALPNGSLFFVSISSLDGITSLRWENTFSGDGWGVDDFGTVSSVPEPTSMLLLGVGLLGLAGVVPRLRRK